MASEDVMIWEPNEREQEWLNNHKKIRSYEVSIWTLQDDFITVLKHANIENKGQIQNGKLIIKDDGTEELTFTIPMYLYDQQKNILGENTIWYNTINGNIAVDMRKIKLIFNKGSDTEKVYEFLIVKVNERHVKDELFCDVSCEGLAFHELGKIGYKISLSAEDVNRDVEQWEEEDPEIKIKNEDQILVYKYKGNTPEERLEAYKAAYPLATLQYWLNKFLLPEPEEGSNEEVSPNKWYYKVEMNYDAFEDRQNRNSSTIYEESYPASWDTTDDKKITVVRIEPYKEKARLVDLEESNIYNLTQNLAETFEIFRRYEYSHDLNYHITGRKIIFYNNFIYDNESFIDFTYPYSTSEITREMDSTDLITKMFVRSIEDDTTASGLLTIIDTAANKTGEDYLLNFDYLYDIKAISEEQYKTVSSYEATMKKLNLEIAPLESQIIALSARVPDLEAKVTIAKNAIQLDTERISAAKDLFDALTEGDGEIEITPDSPDTAILLEDDKNAGSYFIRLSKHGIDASSIRIFRNFNIGQTEWYATEVINGEANGRLYNELKTGQIEYDEFGDVVRVRNLYIEDKEDRKLVFVVYNYTPKLYYDRVVQTWTLRLEKDQTDKNRYEAELKQVNARLQEVQEAYNERIAEKQKEIKKFEAAMGPALREGYWAPDDYKDCGDNYIDDFIISTVYQYGEDEVNQYNHQPKQDDTEKQTLLDSFLWDTELFSDEFDCKHEVGVNQAPELYPCIDLSEFISSLINDSTITEEEYKRRIENLSFFFYDLNGSNSYDATLDPGQMRSFSVGSQCQYGFIKKNNEVIPVLILNGVNTLPETITIKRTVTNQNVDGEQTEYNIESTTVNTLSFLKTKPMFLGALKVDTEHNKVLTFDWSYRIKITNQIDDSNDWIDGPYETVYPRIKIDSLAVKTSSDQLYVGYNKQKLENIKDYYSFSRLAKEELFNEEFSADNTKLASYYITIKPETILKLGGLGKNLNIKYIISNADTAIYLDSKKVLKENAYPKVAYTIKLSILNREFMYDAYRRLCYITHINDAELKFQNVMGYISQMELNLDKPWEDVVEVKNYKTKFEDLFSTILASTEQMKKTGYVMQSAAAAFDAYGSIRPWALEGTIYKADLDYAFNNGKLTIDEKNGIWGVSESGVVAIRGGGIFTSTENDGKGNWKWNTGITPEGINATLITAGQLDTNRVMVYAGDKLRFQLNGQGLFAYKSFFEDIDAINEWIRQTGINSNIQSDSINFINDKLNHDENSDLDATQFVKLDMNGLFLVAKEGAIVLNNDKSEYLKIENGSTYNIKYKTLQYNQDNKLITDQQGNPDYDYNSIIERVMSIPRNGLNRIEISWDGLIMRDWTNTKTFFADPDTGDLYLSGTIFASNFYLIDDDYANGYYDENGNPKRMPFIDWYNLKFEDHVKVSETLGEIFGIAGKIISTTRTSLSDIANIVSTNFNILDSFREDVAKNLTPHNSKGPYHESHFKAGDIWEETNVIDNKTNLIEENLNEHRKLVQKNNNPYANSSTIGTYIAMYNWDELYSNDADAKAAISNKNGWNRTYDGSLAQIKGASINHDAVSGIISLLAENKIDIKTGGYLYLAADKAVDIVSNKEVNIGGTYINIGSAQVIDSVGNHREVQGTGNTEIEGGIRLVSSKVVNHTLQKQNNNDGSISQKVNANDQPISLGTTISNANGEDNYDPTLQNSTSKVYILPSGIEMASKNGIQIKSGAGINILSSAGNINTGENKVAVISIDKDKGIWMGSDQTISLFSGKKVAEVNGMLSSGITREGAAVEISSQRILFGVTAFHAMKKLNNDENLEVGETIQSLKDSLVDATVVDLTKDQLVLGAGANIEHLAELTESDVLLTGENVSGVVIKPNSIGMAVGQKTGNDDTRILISMDEEGIILGKAADLATIENGIKVRNDALEGSFIKLTNEGVFLGSKGQFYINTTNVYIDDSTAHKQTQSNPNGIWKGAAFGLGQGMKDWSKWNDDTTILTGESVTEFSKWGLIFDGEDLHIKGNIYANNITIHDRYTNDQNQVSEDQYTWNEYFQKLFNIAADIISDIHNSAGKLQEETALNKIILTEFQQKIQNKLDIKYYVTNNNTHEREETGNNNYDGSFKPGDYWERPDGTYLAMAYSWEVFSGTIDRKSTNGWNLIVDNTLTAPKVIGAQMYQDADTGIISMWAANGIHLFSDNRIKQDGTVQTITGTSAIDITPAGIVLAATKKIELGVSNVSTDGTTGAGTISGGAFTGIRLSAVDGLWLGSDKAIKLFASETSSTSSANMTISPEEILFGVVSNNTTVVDITRTKIIMGVVDTQATNQQTYLATGQPTITTNENGIITSVSGTAGMRIMKDSFGLVTRSNNTDNVILLDESGIGIASKKEVENNSPIYSGIIIRPSMLVMTTAGKVQLIGNSGVIVFGANKDKPNFRVDEFGNVYCKSLTCEDGMVSGSQQPTQTTNTNVSITSKTITFGEIRYRNSTTGDGYDQTKYFSNITVSQVGEYLLKVTYSKDSDPEGSHGYFQNATITIDGKTYDASFPFTSDTNNKIFTYSVYLNNTSFSGSIHIKLDAESMPILPNFEAKLEFYPNFKGSSTQNDMAAGWSNQTYTATDKNTSEELAKTTISGAWDSSILTGETYKKYRVKANDTNNTEVLNTYVTGSWDSTYKKYKVYSENSTSNILTETQLSGSWDSSGNYTVYGTDAAGTQVTTGLTTNVSPSLTVSINQTSSNSGTYVGEIESPDSGYRYVNISTSARGASDTKYVRVKAKAAVDNTKTIGNITGTQTKSINSCDNRLDYIEFNTYGYYYGDSRYSYSGKTHISLVSLLTSILNHSNFKINGFTPQHITYASHKNTETETANDYSMCIINCYGDTDDPSDTLATITLPFSIAEFSSSGTFKERES